MNPNLTDITLVLDRSGSMGVVADDTIGGVNRFLEEQRNAPGDCAFTLYQFDSEFERVVQVPDIRHSENLSHKTFVPRGSTALLDAIARAITLTGERLGKTPEDKRPGKVVFVIVTDGAENASKEFSRAQVFDLIKHQREKYSWEFVFLGANQDAISAGLGLGVKQANAMTYAHNTAGVTAAFFSVSKNLRSYRAGTKMDTSFDDEDVKAQKDAGAP